MEIMLDFLWQMFSVVLVITFVENTVLSRAIGSSTSLWVIRKKYSIALFGAVITIITTASAIIVYFMSPWVKSLENSYYLMPLIYVLVISVVYISMILIVNRLKIKQKKMVTVFIHRCAFNCAVLGALLLSTNYENDFNGYLGFGIGTGFGFTLATYLIDISYAHLNSTKIPKAFRGFPITLIYMGILSLAVYGIIGHELPI